MKNMKKLISIFVIFAMVLQLSAVVQASPAQVHVRYYDKSEFAHLQYMVENATDSQLKNWLGSHHSLADYSYSGITDRKSARAFIKSVEGAVIPVLPDGKAVSWQISIPRGCCCSQRDEGRLNVHHWFTDGLNEGEVIRFNSFYRKGGFDLDFIKANNPGGFDTPTAEKNGVKYYYFEDFYVCDFVIDIDGYILLVNYEHDKDGEAVPKTLQEKLDILLRFDFVRLDELGTYTPKPNEDLSVYEFRLGRILPGDNRRPAIGDALEILKYLAGMDNVISKGGKGSREWRAAMITPKSQSANKPSIMDALEIFKHVGGMISPIGKGMWWYY